MPRWWRQWRRQRVHKGVARPRAHDPVDRLARVFAQGVRGRRLAVGLHSGVPLRSPRRLHLQAARTEDDAGRGDAGGGRLLSPQRRAGPLRLRERRVFRAARPGRPRQDGRAAPDGRRGGLGDCVRPGLLRPLRRRRHPPPVPRDERDRGAWGARLRHRRARRHGDSRRHGG